MHDPVTDLATVPPTPIHPAVIAARSSITRIAADLLAIDDATLERPWRWRPTDPDDLELRYGFYAIHERIEGAIGAIAIGDSSTTDPLGPAVPALRALTAARWELHGALAGLDGTAFDADPGGGEWTIRETLGHVLGGQLSYGWYNAWYLANPLPVHVVVRPPETVFPPEPTEEELGAGTPAEVAARLDEIADASIVANAALDAASLELGARWAGLPVTIGFRLGRYGSHVREHTIQVDKTLAMLGREPTEAERLVRLVLATYGRLEALVIARPAAELDRAFADGSSTIDELAAAVAAAEATASSVTAAARG